MLTRRHSYQNDDQQCDKRDRKGLRGPVFCRRSRRRWQLCDGRLHNAFEQENLTFSGSSLFIMPDTLWSIYDGFSQKRSVLPFFTH